LCGFGFCLGGSLTLCLGLFLRLDAGLLRGRFGGAFLIRYCRCAGGFVCIQRVGLRVIGQLGRLLRGDPGFGSGSGLLLGAFCWASAFAAAAASAAFCALACASAAAACNVAVLELATKPACGVGCAAIDSAGWTVCPSGSDNFCINTARAAACSGVSCPLEDHDDED
jgi:hypothetical protein